MQKEVTAFINVVHPNAKVPEYGTPLSAGFDLAIVDQVALGPGDSDVFSTGQIIQAPSDHFILVAPRSSTFRKWGVTLGNTIGIVDEDYCGPDDVMRLYVHNPGKTTVFIPAGTRIAQGLFIPVTRASFLVVDGPIAKSRGGWGSTGD